VPFKGELGIPILHNVAWAEVYLPIKWHLDPSSRFATTGMCRKLGVVPLWGKGGWVPISHNVGRAEAYLHTLIYPTIWPQKTWAENWEAAVFLSWGELGPVPIQHNVAGVKFHLDPSNRLATIQQHYRQDRQTAQRSDSIGQTVLQTVAQ